MNVSKELLEKAKTAKSADRKKNGLPIYYSMIVSKYSSIFSTSVRRAKSSGPFS